MAEKEVTLADEWQKVEDWRRYELTVAGYPDSLARKLARRHEIDLHEAVGLLERGCSPEVAYKILR